MPAYSNPTRNQATIVNWVIAVVLGLGLIYMSFGLMDAEIPVPFMVRVTGIYLGLLTLLTPWLTNKDSVEQEPDRVQAKGLPAGVVWAGVAFFLILAVVPIKAVAAGGGGCGAVACDHMEPDLTDKASLQSGAKYFVNYCMGCHSLEYSRWERVATDLEIPEDLMIDNLVLGDDRYGDLMSVAMPAAQSKAWFGATPPDLTLVARSRNPEWLYTYLRNFYKDESRPTGVNNKVFDKVAMPHVLMELQGLPECAPGEMHDDHGHVLRNKLGEAIEDENCGKIEVGKTKGSMSEKEFDKVVYDMVNFMEYVAEPSAMDRKRIGVYSLLFVAVFFVFAYLLNREYWRDLH
ncbi:cytochrome c1 [Halioxenophilus aromaticivorans]